MSLRHACLGASLLLVSNLGAETWHGRVTRAGSGVAMEGVEVALSNGASALSGPDGAFVLELPETLTLTVKVLCAGCEDDAWRELIKPWPETLSVVLSGLEEPLTRVIARRHAPQPSSQTLSRAETRRVAGAAGDVLRAVAALPGANVANDYLANLLVRGGGFEDNLIFFDGFPAAYPFHFGGVESVFHPGMLERADFYPSGFDARYGDAQGGILDLKARQAEPGFHGETGLSLILAGLNLSQAGSAGSWQASGSFRRGYFDLVLDPQLTLTGVPRYQDYAFRTTGPWLGGEARVTVFGAQDELKVRTTPDQVLNNPALAGDSGWQSYFHTLGIGWLRPLGDWSLEAKASASLARVAIGLGPDLFLDRQPYEWLGQIEASGLVNGGEHKPNLGLSWRQTRTSLRGQFRRLPVEFGSGFDFESLDLVNVDALGSKAVLSAWAQDRWELLQRVVLTAGARFEHVDVGDEAHFSPRASLEGLLWRGMVFRSYVGDYYQSVNGLETVPGWTTGFERGAMTRAYGASLTQSWGKQEFKIETYQKGFERRLPAYVINSPQGLTFTVNAANTGSSQGLELTWRLRPVQGVFAWLSYAYNETLRSRLPGEPQFPADFSQPHVVNAVLSWTRGPWEAGARYRFASGIPYTPVLSRSYDLVKQRWLPVFGSVNSARLEDYQRLDIRLQRQSLWPRWQARIFLEFINALDLPNVTSVTYNDDYSDLRRVRQLPRLLFAGMELEF